MYARILVPVDGSGPSQRGLEEAIRLAKSLGARMKVVHVVNAPVLDPNYASIQWPEALMTGLRESGARVIADAGAAAKREGLQVEIELLETVGGGAAKAIVQAARDWQADLIVMGTHGRRGLSRLALGSDAEMVLRTSPVPVLLVREAAEPA